MRRRTCARRAMSPSTLPAVLAALLVLGLAGLAGPALAEEIDLTIPEADKGPWEFGGMLETRYVNHLLNQDSALYRLRYYNQRPGSYTEEWRPQLELKADYKQGIAHFHLYTHHEYHEFYSDYETVNKVYEGYVSLKPSAGVTIEAGKKSFSWGKGYAFNPAGFVNRPKDPDDPELNLEGFTALGADFIKSLGKEGLQTIAFTPLILPVFNNENTELGQTGDVNYAAKLYLLAYDTDIDLMYLGGPNQSDSYGLDFSKNLLENLEVHGELAYVKDARRQSVGAGGGVNVERENQVSYLLGLRYLTERDTTYILEYFHNGAGYGGDQVDGFFAYQEMAWRQWLATQNPLTMQRADTLTRSYYRAKNFGQDYLYLKVSQKEPFDILYLTPYLSFLVNLADLSFNVAPGLTYSPITNLELNLRVIAPIGGAATEFGEKLDDLRSEIWLRWYF